MTYRDSCPLCGSAARVVGCKAGTGTGQWYELRLCDCCQFGFVANPSDNYDEIYSEDYYAGRGADPLVDYIAEMRSPQTSIRRAEWDAVMAVAASLVPPGPQKRWLDYGCGNGLLVRQVNLLGGYDCYGYEVSTMARRAAEAGAPLLDDQALQAAEGIFDLVTAVEVLEHVADPIAELKRIYRLVRPGGVFFYTTGNSTRHQHRLTEWSYVRPDIHISYFNPANAAMALRSAGFVPERLGFRPGAQGIIRFKVLKVLRQRQQAWWHHLIPWTLVARALNRYYGIFDMPYGRRPTDVEGSSISSAK